MAARHARTARVAWPRPRCSDRTTTARTPPIGTERSPNHCPRPRTPAAAISRPSRKMPSKRSGPAAHSQRRHDSRCAGSTLNASSSISHIWSRSLSLSGRWTSATGGDATTLRSAGHDVDPLFPSNGVPRTVRRTTRSRTLGRLGADDAILGTARYEHMRSSTTEPGRDVDGHRPSAQESPDPSAHPATAAPIHTFHAVAFVENLSLKELAPAYPEAKRTPHELTFVTPSGGTVFVYPFGAVVFFDVPAAAREAELTRLHRARPGLTPATVKEEFTVRDDAAGPPGVHSGVLTLDRMTFERASVVALTVAQSAAMEYYDRIVDQMFAETDQLVDRLEKAGTVPLSTRPLHRFI